jgi:tetratricopeptide (TPR) repeat protein
MDHSMDVTKAKASASASADAGAGAGAGSPSVADVARDGDEQDVGSRAQIHDASLKNGLPLPGALSPWVPKSEFQNSETSDSSSAGITSSPPEHCPRVYIVNRRHNAIVKREMQHRHCNYKKAGQDILEQLKYFQHKSPFLVIDEQSTSTGQEDERKHGQQLAVFGAANAVTGSDGIHKDDIVSVAMAGSYQQDDSSSRPWENSSDQSAQQRNNTSPVAVKMTRTSKASGTNEEYRSAASALTGSEKWPPILHFDEGMLWCKSLIEAPAHAHCADSSYHQHGMSGSSCYDKNDKLRASCDEHRTISLATFHYNLGKCHEMQGHFDTAMECYGKALQFLEVLISSLCISAATKHNELMHLKWVLDMSIGQVKFQQKLYHEAAEHYQTALNVVHSVDQHKNQIHPPGNDATANTAAALMNCLGVVSLYSFTSSMERKKRTLTSSKDNRERSDKVALSCSGDWLQKALDIRRRLLRGNSSPDEVATTLNNLGRFHHQQGDFMQAKAMFLEALRIHKCSVYPDAAATVFNLGELERHEEFLDLVGQHLDPIDAHEVPEELNLMLSSSNVHLANCYFNAQNFERAPTLYLKALEAQNLHEMAVSGIWNKIGHCWFQLGKWSGAVRAYEVVLEDEEDALELQPQLLSDSGFIENRLITLRQLAEALIILAEGAAETGPDDQGMKQDYCAAALRRYGQVFELQERHAGTSTDEAVEEMSTTLLCMASLHFRLHRTTYDGVTEALKCFDRAKQFYGIRVDLVANHLQLAYFMSRAGAMLAKAAVEQRDNVQDLLLFDILTDLALQELNDSVKCLYRSSSEATAAQNEAIVSNLNHMGIIYRYKGNYQLALLVHGQSERWSIHFDGNDATSLVQTRSNIAVLYLELGELELAYQMYQTVLEAQVRAFGEEHEDVVCTRFKLAEIYREAGDLDLARDEYENMLQLQLLIFKSSDHVDVGDTLLAIADVYQRQGNLPHMLQAYDMAVQIYNRIEVQPESRFMWGIKWYKIRRMCPAAAA